MLHNTFFKCQDVQHTISIFCGSLCETLRSRHGHGSRLTTVTPKPRSVVTFLIEFSGVIQVSVRARKWRVMRGAWAEIGVCLLDCHPSLQGQCRWRAVGSAHWKGSSTKQRILGGSDSVNRNRPHSSGARTRGIVDCQDGTGFIQILNTVSSLS